MFTSSNINLAGYEIKTNFKAEPNTVDLTTSAG